MKTTPLLLLTGLVIFTVGCATKPMVCCSEPRGMRSQFAKADSNNDGKVTKAEFGVLRVEEAFKLFDDNENGVITVDEFVASGGSKAAFAKLDQSGNGQITLGEAMASEVVMDSMLTTFYEADTNGDGVVTLAEALAYRQAVREYTGNNPRI